MSEKGTFLLMGEDPSSSIEFIALPEISDQSFNVSACFRGYRVTETSVTVFGKELFLEQLSAFERGRQGAARLEGTYNFELTVEPYGTNGAALVSFCVENLLMRPDNKYGQCRLEGAFVVSGEYVAAMLFGFENVFSDTSRAAEVS